LQVKWINKGTTGGRGAIASGLRQNDVVVAVEGKPLKDGMNPKKLNTYIKLNYEVGETLPITVLRKGRQLQLEIKLVE